MRPTERLAETVLAVVVRQFSIDVGFFTFERRP